MTGESHPAHECLIFCCPGASNVGVLSFQAAIRLAQEGFGAFSCIAGIGSKNLWWAMQLQSLKKSSDNADR